MTTEPDATAQVPPMIWAVRAVPVLIIFGALDLLKDDLPLSFLVLTLLRLAAGVAILVVIHRQRRDKLALAYVAFVCVTSLPHPIRGGELLILAVLALVATGVDLLLQRRRAAKASAELPHPVGGDGSAA